MTILICDCCGKEIKFQAPDLFAAIPLKTITRGDRKFQLQMHLTYTLRAICGETRYDDASSLQPHVCAACFRKAFLKTKLKT